MSLLRLGSISKSFAGVPVLTDVSWRIGPGEKVALLGPNGAGKTTLLRIVAGEIAPDGGSVSRAPGLRIGLARQQTLFDANDPTPVWDALLSAAQDVTALEERQRDLLAGIATLSASGQDSEDLHDLLVEYGHVQERFHALGGWSLEARAASVLAGLGFSDADRVRPLSQLSGGQRSRVGLARLLLAEPDLLLLDEPTNHLDIDAVEWLEEFVAELPEAVVVVSHDRRFLDRTVSRIAAIEDGRLALFEGNYTAYREHRAAALATAQRAYDLQAREIARQEEFIRRNIAGQKTKQAQSRRKMLAKMERLERPTAAAPVMKLRLDPTQPTADVVLRVKGLAKSYEDPERRGARRRVLAGVEFAVKRGERLGVVGPNGSGKSTLARILAGELLPDAGHVTWAPGVRVGFYDQDHQNLTPGHSVLECVWEVERLALEEVIRSYLGRFLFRGDEVFQRVESLSGGERGRASLARLLLTRPNVLLLDEPTNHLDVDSRTALEDALEGYAGTIIVVSHDRYFLDRIARELFVLGEGEPRIVHGSYTEFRARRGKSGARSAAKPVVPVPPPAAPRAPDTSTRGVPPKASAPAREKKRASEGEVRRRQREAAAAEQDVAARESDLKALSEELSSHATGDGYERILELSRRYEEVQADLQRAIQRWEKASEALEKARGTLAQLEKG